MTDTADRTADGTLVRSVTKPLGTAIVSQVLPISYRSSLSNTQYSPSLNTESCGAGAGGGVELNGQRQHNDRHPFRRHYASSHSRPTIVHSAAVLRE